MVAGGWGWKRINCRYNIPTGIKCVGTETDCDNIIIVGGAVNLGRRRRRYSHRAKLLVRVCYDG